MKGERNVNYWKRFLFGLSFLWGIEGCVVLCVVVCCYVLIFYPFDAMR